MERSISPDVRVTLVPAALPPCRPAVARPTIVNMETHDRIPLDAADHPTEEVKGSTLPGGPAAFMVHIGPYEDMEPALEALAAWMRARGVEPSTGRPTVTGDAMVLRPPSGESESLQAWRGEGDR
jgi:hypothetical protein